MNERGMSTLIASLILIVLCLIALSFVGLTIKNSFEEGADKISIDQFTLDLEISRVQVLNETDIEVTVKRNVGEGDLSGVAFVLYDNNNSEIVKQNISMKELEEKNFSIILKVVNATLIEKISIAPIFKRTFRKDILGNIQDEKPLRSGGGGGSSGGGGTSSEGGSEENVEEGDEIPVCGDGNCVSGESCLTCSNDCGDCSYFTAGISKVEITPPIGQPLGGYGNYGGCTGINDPLYARIIVIQDSGVSVAIISVDLLMFSSDNVIDKVKQQYGIDHVIIGSTHTHSGGIPTQMTIWSNLNVNPEEQLDWSTFPNDPWYSDTEDKIIIAVGEAWNNMFSANLSAGKGTLESNYFAHNRRVVNEDGSVTMLWSNPSRTPTSPVDNTVGVIRINNESGITRAMIVNYASHAVHGSSSNNYVSADYPGVMSDYIENELGPDSIALFIPGAGGDIDPYFQGYDSGNNFQYSELAGTDLAQQALGIVTENTGGGSIEVDTVTLNFTDRWNPSKTHLAGMTNIVIHNSIALVTFVGEAFVQHQIDLYERSPLPNTFLYGYTYSGLGGHYLMYLPTIQATTEGGYGAGSTTYLQVGAGELMINKSLDFIRQFSLTPCTDNCSNLGYECGSQTVCGSILNCGPLNETQSCPITNGVGEQTKICDNGNYGSWSTCTVVSCNSGYVQSGNSCVLENPSPPVGNTGYIIADHNSADDFEIIPQCWIGKAKQDFKIGYGHTSHGSQITSGISGLNSLLNSEGVYPQNLFSTHPSGYNGALALMEGGSYDGTTWLAYDVGYGGWDTRTRDYLNSAEYSDRNVIMWSWCGQVNDVNLQTHYFDNMADLESEYPNVEFIYMTGHLESNQAVLSANNQIRNYVKSVNGTLFDFADIEKWDPNGVEYPLETDACGWCSNWCSAEEDCTAIYNAVSYCAHSHDYNCYRKAKAFWWMMARMAGWDGEAGDDVTDCL